MPLTPTEAVTKIAKLETNLDRLDQIVNGDEATTVETDAGPVPSLAKVIADTGYEPGAAAIAVEAQGAAEDAATGAAADRVRAGNSVPWLLRSGLVASTGAVNGDRTTVTADTGTHTAVSGEVALGGVAATVGAAIPNEGNYTYTSGAWLRTGDTENQRAAAKAALAASSVDAANVIVASAPGASVIPAATYGWIEVTTDKSGRVVRGIRLDGSYFDALNLYPTTGLVPASAYNADRPGAFLDASGRVILGVDTEGRLTGSFAGDFTPSNPTPMPYIGSGNLMLAGQATKIAGGAANWPGGPTQTFVSTCVEGHRIRAAVQRGASVDGYYYDKHGNAGFYDPNMVAGYVGNGQSLSCGTRGRGFVTQLLRSLRIRMPRSANRSDIRCGQWPEVGSANFAPVDPNSIVGDIMAHAQFTPIDASNFGETTLERMMKVISDGWFAVTGRRQQSHIASLGVGTATIDQLAKGAAAPSPWVPNPANVYKGIQWDLNIYNNQMARIARFVDLYAAQGLRYEVHGVDFTQGESGSTDSAWDTKLATLIGNWNADVKAITGQTRDPVWVMVQPTAVASTAGYQATQLAAIRAHDAGVIHLIKPQYPELGRNGFAPDPFGFSLEYVHKLAPGYAINGEMSGKAFLSIFSQNQRPSILRPLSGVEVAGSGGTQWDFDFEVPVAPIVLDDSPGFAVPANYGLTYSDSGAGASITAVAVQAPKRLRVTFSADIRGRTVRLLRCGMNGPPINTQPTATTMARTAIRDSATTVSEVDGQINRNFCLHSEVAF